MPTADAITAAASGNLAPDAPFLGSSAASGNVSPSTPGLTQAASGGNLGPDDPEVMVDEVSYLIPNFYETDNDDSYQNNIRFDQIGDGPAPKVTLIDGGSFTELSVAVDGAEIEVTCRTALGMILDTAAEVIDAINADPEASAIIVASNKTGSDGSDAMYGNFGPWQLAGGGISGPENPAALTTSAGGNLAPTAPGLTQAASGGNLAPSAPFLASAAAGGNLAPSTPFFAVPAAGGNLSPTAPGGIV